MDDAPGGGDDILVDIPAGQLLIPGANEDGHEDAIRHGTIVIGGIPFEKSFLRFEAEDVARQVHANLSELNGDSFLKSCLIIEHEGYYWLAVDRFDCSLERYCDNNPIRWEGSPVRLDQNQEVTRWQLRPTYQQIVRDIITGIYQLHSQHFWHGDLSIRDILIVNHRAKFAFVRARGGLPDERGEDFVTLRTVFRGVLAIAYGGQYNMPRAELNHFHNAARRINNWDLTDQEKQQKKLSKNYQ